MAANPISQHQCYTELSSKPVSAIKKKIKLQSYNFTYGQRLENWNKHMAF